MDIRRLNIGAYPSFALLELTVNIPDEVMAHPDMDCLLINAIDMIILGNVRYVLYLSAMSLSPYYDLSRTYVRTTSNRLGEMIATTL
jgi:hypothetical protein